LGALFGQVLMFWTGHQRDTSSVLGEQKQNTVQKSDSLFKMREQAKQLQALLSNGHFDGVEFGQILDEGWKLKRCLASTITTADIDRWYHVARRAGALGGKLCGAGGGGFLLFLVPPSRHDHVRKAMGGLKEISVAAEVHGSQILFAE
jgi:D-glycero-alpha-D-manno-heptose-7-phosphate kinase